MTVPELAIADTESATITSAEARALTDRIKVAVDGTWLLIQEAYISRAWSVLGYASWDDYCTREFGTSRLRLPREERQEVVASLREIGMSQRAIASATGDSPRTVRRALSGGAIAPPDRKETVGDQKWSPSREISGEPNGSPEPGPQQPELTRPGAQAIGPPAAVQPPSPAPAPARSTPRPITGTDGKSYPMPQRQAAPQRSPLPTQFRNAATDLGRVVARLERLQDDDRYRANRQAVANQCLPEIRRAASVLHGLLLDLGHDSGDPT